ncbi:YHYH domain-containing protein [Synechococcus sp. PCC 7335]
MGVPAAGGCHTNRSTGDYHCHNGGSSSSEASRPS